MFAGFSNYAQVFADPSFRQGVGRVLLFGVVQIPVMLVFATILALLLDSVAVRFRRFFRLAFFLPYGIPGVIAAILWSFLYLPGLSPIVAALQHTGFGTVNFLGTNSALWSIANIVTWEYTGYNMLIIYAALQAIPADLYEAGRLDGASEWKMATRIKLPMVASALVLTAVFSIIGTLQLFSEPQVLRAVTTNISSSYTPNLLAYTQAFTGNNPNYAAAIAVVLAIGTFILSFGFLQAGPAARGGGVMAVTTQAQPGRAARSREHASPRVTRSGILATALMFVCAVYFLLPRGGWSSPRPRDRARCTPRKGSGSASSTSCPT